MDRKQLARLLDGQLGRPAFGDAVFDAAHGGEEVEGDGVALDQGVEEMPQRGQGLVPGPAPSRRDG